MGMSWQHILIFLVIALLLFGRGKISELMGDVAKGIKAFKHGMNEDETATKVDPQVPPHVTPAPTINAQPTPVADPRTSEHKVG